jgi:hypothetical protein
MLIAAPLAVLAQPLDKPRDACSYLAGLIPIEGGPLFLPSYPAAGDGPLRSAAFLYDNAVAAIALVGCGEVPKARRIGDAIVAALDGDRAWHDGRLRNAYAAGPVDQSPVKLSGWWDPVQQHWNEDRYQVSSDSGNVAWAMLALLAIDQARPDPRYRAAALRIGTWLAGRSDDRGAGGFTGGFSGWEPSPALQSWKSTEHNTDLAAAFILLSRATGEAIWQDRARYAARFVAAMWDNGCNCFMAGTGDDGVTPNRILPVDAQVWPLLALAGMATTHSAAVLETADRRLRGGSGYSYSDAGHGLWTEGTAYVALLQNLLGHADEAKTLNAAVAAQRAPEGGYFATADASLATGFTQAGSPQTPLFYYHVPHLGATAWAALAQKGFNPFTASSALP